MPYVNLPISPRGPVVVANFGMPRALADQMRAGEKQPPNPVIVEALIDTGAGSTMVDPVILRQLNLNPIDKALVNTASSGGSPVQIDVYEVDVFLHDGSVQKSWQSLRVGAADLSQQGIQALIGRDMLAHCLFVYNGTSGLFAFAF
jgi:predicted aspartyl protease